MRLICSINFLAVHGHFFRVVTSIVLSCRIRCRFARFIFFVLFILCIPIHFLIFLSCYGRATAIQQLLAAFQLKLSAGGLDHFRLEDELGNIETVFVGDPNRLEKFSGRLPRENLFGNLVHSWIFDPVVMRADYSNRIAWGIEPQAWADMPLEQMRENIWETYRMLSPVPLLDHWCEPLLRATADDYITLMHKTAYRPIGRCSAFRVHLDDSFLERVSDLVKRGVLTLEPQAEAQLKLAA